MLLSIFNFKRQIPSKNWSRLFWISALSTLGLTGLWEAYVRHLGYDATLNDNADLWAEVRTKLEKSAPTRTVIVGSSRIQFDFDLKTYADYFDTPEPIQLALYGSNPVPILEHIAYESKTSGTILVGVTPILWFVPEGESPVARSRDTLEYYQNWSISQRIAFQLWKPLDLHLAFLQEEDLKLNSLIQSLNIPNRPQPNNIAPLLPPYFNRVESNRRATLWEKLDEPLATKIQQRWIPLFTPPPPPPQLTEAQFQEIVQQNMQSYLSRIAKAVKTIEQRGGTVIFIRFPSSGTLRQLENKFAPRPLFWDAILATSGAKGIHFEDYPELSGFECPEWSHLSKKDSIEFTRRLIPLLNKLSGMSNQKTSTHKNP
jgi:hypothetical protein